MATKKAGYDCCPRTAQVISSAPQAQRCPADRFFFLAVVIAHPPTLFYVRTGANSSIDPLDTLAQRRPPGIFISISPATLMPNVCTTHC